MSTAHFKPQIVGVVGCPNPRANKHLMLTVLVYVQINPNLVECWHTPDGWWGSKSIGCVALNVSSAFVGENSNRFACFWNAKITAKKNINWFGFAPRDLLKLIPAQIRRQYPVSPSCLFRFAQAARIDPWRGGFCGFTEFPDALDFLLQGIGKYILSYSNDQWQDMRQRLVVAAHCDLMSYVLADNKVDPWRRLQQTALEASCHSYLAFTSNLKARLGSLKPWKTSVGKANKASVVKAVRRAMAKTQISTHRAREFFRKFNALSLLSGWAKREKLGQKHQQTA